MNVLPSPVVHDVELPEINLWSRGLFAAMATSPLRHSLLEEAGPGAAVVGVGALVGGEAAGLLLAQLAPDGSFAVRTLYVREPHRGRGLEEALLDRFETLARGRGAPSLSWLYPAQDPASPAIRRLLDMCRWSPDVNRRHVFHCAGTMLGERWLAERPLPPGVRAFPWSDLTAERRSDLERWATAQEWVPPGLAPGNVPDVEAGNSLGLSLDGSVIGWVLTQRVSASGLRYAALLVCPRRRYRGLGAWLIAAAIRRQAGVMGPSFTGTFAVSVGNLPMLRVVERRLKSHVISHMEMSLATKTLDSSSLATL